MTTKLRGCSFSHFPEKQSNIEANINFFEDIFLFAYVTKRSLLTRKIKPKFSTNVSLDQVPQFTFQVINRHKGGKGKKLNWDLFISSIKSQGCRLVKVKPRET